jgi:hypothetical protein
MKRSLILKSRKVLALATLFGAMVTTTLLCPAYGQQDVDPTWYNPWAASNTTAVQTTQPKAAVQARRAKIKTVSHRTAKNSSQRVATQTKPS